MPICSGIGIDLGTTNTVVCYKSEKGIETFTWKDSAHFLPSIISYDNEKPNVGDFNGKKVASNMKRLIGKHSTLIKDGTDIFGGIVENKDGNLRVLLKGSSTDENALFITPVDAAAQILKYIMDTMTKHLDVTVDELGPITIGIPANFQYDERSDTLTAAQRAGINNCFLLNEPTAAALDYCFERNISSGYYIIYDLGGGTFDTTLIKYTNDDKEKQFQIVGSKGIDDCGGIDLDKSMLRLMKQFIKNQIRSNPDNFFHKRPAECDNAEVMNKILSDKKLTKLALEKAKAMKEAMSNRNSNCHCTTECNCTYSCDLTTIFKAVKGLRFTPSDDEDNPLIFNCTRSQYKEEISFFLDSTTSKVKELLENTPKEPITIDDVKGIILVGGSSNLWCIPELLKQRFPTLEFSKIWKDISPLTCVAHGCCHYSLAKNVNILDNKSLIIDEVSSYSYGIAVAGGMTYNLIKQGSRIPSKVTQYFTTTKDNQEVINTAAYIGDSEYTSENRLIQHIQFSPISKQPKGIPKLEITYEILQSNLLDIYCYEIFDNGTKKSLGKQSLKLE